MLRVRAKKSELNKVQITKEQYEMYYFDIKDDIQIDCLFFGSEEEAYEIAIDHYFNEFSYFLMIYDNKIVRMLTKKEFIIKKSISKILKYRKQGEFLQISKRNLKSHIKYKNERGVKKTIQ